MPAGAVDEVVDLAFEHRLEVRLHLPPGDFDHDAHIHGALGCDIGEVRPTTSTLPSVTSSSWAMCRYSKAARVLAAEFDAHVGLAHHLAFEG